MKSWKSLVLNEIIHILGNYESTKMADHILEMAELGLFCDNCFKKILLKSGCPCWMPQTVSKFKDDFEFIKLFILFRAILCRILILFSDPQFFMRKG